MLDNLLKILREETDLYGLALGLARDENDALMGSDLDGLRTAADGKAAVAPRIQELEQEREAVVEELAGALGRPGEGLSLREISQLAEEPYATQLKDCRSHLLDLATSLSDISSRNKKLIAHRLKLVRSCLSFLNNLTVMSAVYHSTGKMLMTSVRSGRVLSGEY